MKAFLLFVLVAVSVWGQTPARRLIMISVDGLMPSTVRDAEKLGLKLANLTEFRDKGAMSEGLKGVFPTVTYPSHTTMVTGVRPAEHGIFANTLFDPEDAMSGAWFWYSSLIKVPTLWQAARASGLKTAGVGWPVTVGADIDYNFPEYKPSRTLNDLLLYRTLVTPGLVPDYEKSKGRMQATEGHYDELLANVAAFLVERHKPHLLLVHLVDLDHEQHVYGPGSPESLRALERADAAIGAIRKAVASAGVSGETRWIIVSDHGFFPVEKVFHPTAFLNSLGLGAEAEKPKTWRVSAHNSGGAIAFAVRDPKDAEAQELVFKALQTLKEDDRWGIDRVLSREELSQLKAFPHAFAGVSLKSGFTAGSARSGPWVTPSPNTKGMHGYLPGPPALDCTFIAFGPGIEARAIPRAELTDVAATAAKLLGIKLPSAGGRDLLN